MKSLLRFFFPLLLLLSGPALAQQVDDDLPTVAVAAAANADQTYFTYGTGRGSDWSEAFGQAMQACRKHLKDGMNKCIILNSLQGEGSCLWASIAYTKGVAYKVLAAKSMEALQANCGQNGSVCGDVQKVCTDSGGGDSAYSDPPIRPAASFSSVPKTFTFPPPDTAPAASFSSSASSGGSAAAKRYIFLAVGENRTGGAAVGVFGSYDRDRARNMALQKCRETRPGLRCRIKAERHSMCMYAEVGFSYRTRRMIWMEAPTLPLLTQMMDKYRVPVETAPVGFCFPTN